MPQVLMWSSTWFSSPAALGRNLGGDETLVQHVTSADHFDCPWRPRPAHRRARPGPDEPGGPGRGSPHTNGDSGRPTVRVRTRWHARTPRIGHGRVGPTSRAARATRSVIVT